MGLIDRLRGHAKIMAQDKGKFVRFIDVETCMEAADALEKLMHYAEHEMGCLGSPHACMCGLGELLKELSDD